MLLSTFVDESLRHHDDPDDDHLLLQNLNSLPELEVSLSSIKSSCEFCHSLPEQAPFIVSWPSGADAAEGDVAAVSDTTSKLTFVSSRLMPGSLHGNLEQLKIF